MHFLCYCKAPRTVDDIDAIKIKFISIIIIVLLLSVDLTVRFSLTRTPCYCEKQMLATEISDSVRRIIKKLDIF